LDESRFKVASGRFEVAPGVETITVVNGSSDRWDTDSRKGRRRIPGEVFELSVPALAISFFSTTKLFCGWWDYQSGQAKEKRKTERRSDYPLGTPKIVVEKEVLKKEGVQCYGSLAQTKRNRSG
jgi:hypothetical protein